MAGFPEFPGNGHAFSAEETGQALAGLIRRDAAGMPVPGMLGGGPKLTAVSAAWKVQVGAFVYARAIAAAVGFSGLSAAEQVDIVSSATVPAGQARIDRVCWNAADSSLVVITGTPGTSPNPPADGGLVRVMQVRVNAGDGAVIQGQITPDFATTGLAGGGEPVRGKIASRSVIPGGAVPVPITFPPGRFSEPPVILVTLVGGGARDMSPYLNDVTAGGATISIGSNSVIPRSVGANWVAMDA